MYRRIEYAWPDGWKSGCWEDRAMRRYRKRGRGDDLVSASEVAPFLYCLEVRRSEHGLGLPPGNRTDRHAGDRHHAGKVEAERVAGGAIGVERVLVGRRYWPGCCWCAAEGACGG